MKVVGLGARNTVDDARDFVATYGTTFPMYWDASAVSWRDFEVLTQPAAVLVAPDGRWIERWSGEFVEAEVLAAIERDEQAAGAPGP